MDGNFKRLIVDRPVDRDTHVRRSYAAVAGVLCAVASLCTLVSSILLAEAAAMTAIGLASFGLLLAFLCFVVPWERVGRYMVYAAPAAATLAIAIAATTIDPTYGFYFVLVAGFVAYTFGRGSVVGLHLALIALALAAPVVIEPEATRKAVACALIFGPGVVLVAVLAIYLRRSSEARERAYREFANDAMALATRIRSRVGPGPGAPLPAREWLEHPVPAVPLRNVGIAKIVRGGPAGDGPEARRATPLSERLPMTAVAIAASIVAAVSTTTALLRDGGERQAAGGGAPALVRDATPRTIAETPGDDPARAPRRSRRERPSGPVESSVTAPTTPATAPSTADPEPAPAGGGGSEPAAPAPTGGNQAPVPTRPQASEPVTEPPPTPIQQDAPAGPVDSALGVAQQTVGPVVNGLQK